MLKEEAKRQFGIKLVKMREEAGYKKASEVADKLDIDPRQLSKYETGTAEPGAMLYDKMLGLYGGKKDSFLQQWETLNPENKAMILSMMESLNKAQKLDAMKQS